MDVRLIPELGRSPGGGHNNLLQYSSLENPRQKSLVGYGLEDCKESDTTESTQHACIFNHRNTLIILTLQMANGPCDLQSEVSPCYPSLSQSLQSCPTLCDPMDLCPPGYSVNGILQARRLESVAISFSRGSSRSRNRTQVSYIYLNCQVGSWPAVPPVESDLASVVQALRWKADGAFSVLLLFTGYKSGRCVIDIMLLLPSLSLASPSLQDSSPESKHHSGLFIKYL